jgi:hypothetical protein
MAYSKLEKTSKVHNNDQIVLILQFNRNSIMCNRKGKGICDRSSSFEIIERKACRSYTEQDSSWLIILPCRASLGAGW